MGKSDNGFTEIKHHSKGRLITLVLLTAYAFVKSHLEPSCSEANFKQIPMEYHKFYKKSNKQK